MDGDFGPVGRSAIFEAITSREGSSDHIERLSLERGETLIEQGTQADTLFLVETGRLKVLRDGIELAEIGAGQVVGEIAFLTGSPRTADVIAGRDSVVLRLTRAHFDDLTAGHPGLLADIARDLASRLANTSARVRPEAQPPVARTIALIPAGDAPLDADFVARLSAQVSAYEPRVRVVDQEAALAELGPGLTGPDAAHWFNQLEIAAPIVLYVGAQNAPDWSARILRQADQVMIVGTAGAPPELSQTERLACEVVPESHSRLVLIHPERRDTVEGTTAWLDSRPAFMHHHVALQDDADVARIARFLTGKAVGFVAAGGGAMGALHTGIVQGLHQRGVTFDIYGGTSVGSAMSGAFAMGLDGDAINKQTGEMFVKGGALAKLTVPKYSLLDHTHFDRYLAKHYTDVLIEDLWFPYYAVATDLSDNSQKVIRRGKLWHAIRASAAIPGALPPFFDGTGSMLADGGSMDNMPYRVMHALKSGPNVVVSFAREGRQTFDVAYEKMPGRRSLLRRLVLPFGKRPPRAPGVVSVVMRAVMARQAADALDLAPDDWLIRPPIPPGTGFLDWKSHDKLYRIGQDTVGALLDEPAAPGDARRHFLS